MRYAVAGIGVAVTAGLAMIVIRSQSKPAPAAEAPQAIQVAALPDTAQQASSRLIVYKSPT